MLCLADVLSPAYRRAVTTACFLLLTVAAGNAVTTPEDQVQTLRLIASHFSPSSPATFSSWTGDDPCCLLLLATPTNPPSPVSEGNGYYSPSSPSPPSSPSTITPWTGVTCNATTGDVTGIVLQGTNLTGTIPSSVYDLLSLQKLDLSLNPGLSGPLLEEISRLSSLNALFLGGCNLTGRLPSSIGALQRLVVIDVHSNQLDGAIPPSVLNLTNLIYFDIANNAFSGELPSFSPLAPLGHLHLDNNRLTFINTTFITQYSSLIHLLAANNSLNQDFPLIPPPSLMIIDLSNNNISMYFNETSPFGSNLTNFACQSCNLPPQPLPDTSTSPSLELLDLSFNNFIGKLPTNLASTNPSLVTVNLARNRLSGPLLSTFATNSTSSNLTMMQTILLSDNRLSGSVPLISPSTPAEPLLLCLFDNKFTSVPPPLLNTSTDTSVLLYGNDLCFPFRESIATVCNSPSRLPLYSPPSFCPTISCPSLFYPSPSDPSCACASPIVVQIYLTASPFYVYNLQVAQLFAMQLAMALNATVPVTQSQILVTKVSSLPPNARRSYIFVSFHLYPLPVASGSGATTTTSSSDAVNSSWSREAVIALQNMLTAMRSIPAFGPYRVVEFQQPVTQQSAPPSSSPSLPTWAIVIIAIAAVVVALCLVFVGLELYWRAQRKAQEKRDEEAMVGINVDNCRRFSLEELKEATGGQFAGNKLGEGASGTVHSGCLKDGTKVAVKRSHPNSKLSGEDFRKEIELLSRLRHRNLVSLLGFCQEGAEKLLVYEFVPRGTLRNQLEAPGGAVLTWQQRLEIALGAARALRYLHFETGKTILHRDIKADNILITDEFEAKVADFGFSKFLEPKQKRHADLVFTHGYLDPEVFWLGLWSHKADVYSFGVVLLEIATGRPAVIPTGDGDKVHVRKAVVQDVDRGGIEAVLDPRLWAPEHRPPAHQFLRLLYLAMRCTVRESDKRPSMREVVDVLERMSSGEEGEELPVCGKCLRDPAEHEEEERERVSGAMLGELNEFLR